MANVDRGRFDSRVSNPGAGARVRRRVRLRARRGVRGAFAVEFVLVLMASMALFIPVGELLRISMFDQALAAATHQAARAAAAEPRNAEAVHCRAAIAEAFQDNRLARWLFDRNGDGSVKVVSAAGGWPNGPTEEVRVDVAADEDLYDGNDWEVSLGCGEQGSWIRVQSRIVIRPGRRRCAWSGRTVFAARSRAGPAIRRDGAARERKPTDDATALGHRMSNVRCGAGRRRFGHALRVALK